MTIRPVSKCQSNFNEVAELCRNYHEPVYITRNGYEDLVLLCAQDYSRSVARLELYDKLAAAQRQIDTGTPVVAHDELFRELRDRINARG